MRVPVTAAILMIAVSAPAFAQLPKALPKLVFDAHGFTTSVNDPSTATGLHVAATDLPSRVKGFGLAATFYPLAGPGLALGVGGEMVMGRGRHVTRDLTGQVPDIRTATRLTSFSGNVSLNFGQRDGWSYVTAGFGPIQLWSYLDDGVTPHSAPTTNTLNLGGGGRWFASRHVAFSFDVRYYFTSPEAQTDTFPGRGRKKLTVLSAGISIR